MKVRWLGVVLAVMVLACGGEGGAPDVPGDAANDVAGDAVGAGDAVVDVPVDAALPPTLDRCGAPSFEWLPALQVGGVVTWEPTDAFAELAAGEIDGMLAAAKYQALSPVKYGARNFRLRYVTQDHGVRREATALVGVPVGATEGEVRPLMLWLHGSTGFLDDCAPSRDVLNGPLATSLGAALGYVTVAPDYLGMIGFGEPSPAGTINPYLVSEATAIASLDSARAVIAALAADPQPTRPDPAKVVLMGGSQGGHAALAVERLAPYYAPELTLVAVAAGVPPIDLQAMATWSLNHLGLATRTLVLAFNSFQVWYGTPADLKGVLTDTPPLSLASTMPTVMATSCDRGPADQAATMEEIFVPAFLQAGAAGNWAALPPWDCFLRENSPDRVSLPRAADVPVLTVFGEKDDLVVAATQRDAVRRMCGAGQRIEYVECAGKGHADSVVAAFPYIHAWTQDRLAGKPLEAAKTCVVGSAVDCTNL